MFQEGIDYTSVVGTTLVNNGAIRKVDDYSITINMAEHLAMLSKTSKGSQFREYFIDLQRKWNDPQEIVKRGYAILQNENAQLKIANERMKPKVLFANAVETSDTSILIGELAKLLNQNGVDIGSKRLFAWLRNRGYLIAGNRSDRNLPTQRSMDLKIFEIKERTYNNPDGSVRVTRTPKVTGKGQTYFVNKFLKEA
ncbi:bacteriophage antirepressor [Companilactobacillus nodensis DSM 19682 = JCM 14932 = NBRC 107160]|uniref:Bacteriophage antirepressor n=2 Tax=Companilactobacillus nodensis TaxID=460870 RepID=A0A0R1K5A5_9LACO|nr:bacteriophage antirepressor [Companilactobacillus nodensis DSM 19682 = JCM 14932 = NBRC 107160]